MNKTEMINYLTKEIETLSTNTMNARNRISFSLLIGPFLVFGSILVANQKNGFSLSIHTKGAWIALALAALAFWALGIIAGLIEEGAWNKCDEWRRCIIEIQSEEELAAEKLEELILYKPLARKITRVYALVFLMILIVFGATAYLATELVRGG